MNGVPRSVFVLVRTKVFYEKIQLFFSGMRHRTSAIVVMLDCMYERVELRNAEQLLATDILVLVTMKNAAKCDT